MATIKDVARRAGVSPGTVSNALSGKRPVSAETRRRILRAIDELGYRPNLVARSLVKRRTNTLAVVISEIEYYVPSRILNGIDAQAEALGYSLLLSLLRDPAREDVGGLVANLVARGVDGIIWAVHQVGNNRAWFQKRRLEELPALVFLTMNPQPGYAVVATDNQAGAGMAVAHLLAEGRRRIGLLAGPPDWWEARERRLGWRRRLEEAGHPTPDEMVVSGDWSAASGEAGLRELVARNPDLDALFVCNDQMAIGALQAAHRMGCRVPDDLAVVGFDNIPESGYFWPPLTTIHQHLLEIGRRATLQLHQIIEARLQAESADRSAHAGEESWHQTIAPSLVVRGSSRPEAKAEAGPEHPDAEQAVDG